VLSFLEDKVAKWWLPDDVVFLEEIPKTSVGKFSKKELRAHSRTTSCQPLSGTQLVTGVLRGREANAHPCRSVRAISDSDSATMGGMSLEPSCGCLDSETVSHAVGLP